MYNDSKINIGLSLAYRLNAYSGLLLPFIFTSLGLFVIFLLVLWRRHKIHNYELIRYVWAWLLIVIALPVVTLEIGAQVESEFFKQYIIIAALILSFAFLILLATWNEIQKVKLGYFSNVEVQFEDFIIKSTATDFYIGKTKSYLFFYSTENNSATVYPTGKLKSIKYTPQ